MAKRQIAHEPRRISVPKNVISCTNCESRRTGAIGNNRYFCADCCHEFTVGTVDSLFMLTMDGNAVRIAG